MPTRDALSLAQSRSLDLVEVAPTAQPPVCRLMDYGKFRYDQGKREREQRKTQKTIVIKELRLYPKMSEHDQETRVKAARRFLEEGHKVKFVVQFRGRENAHPELGREMLIAIGESLRDVGTVEQAARLEGRNMSMMITQRTDHARTTPRPPREVPAEQAASDGASATPPSDTAMSAAFASANATPPPADTDAAPATAPTLTPAPTEAATPPLATPLPAASVTATADTLTEVSAAPAPARPPRRRSQSNSEGQS